MIKYNTKYAERGKVEYIQIELETDKVASNVNGFPRIDARKYALKAGNALGWLLVFIGYGCAWSIKQLWSCFLKCVAMTIQALVSLILAMWFSMASSLANYMDSDADMFDHGPVNKNGQDDQVVNHGHDHFKYDGGYTITITKTFTKNGQTSTETIVKH